MSASGTRVAHSPWAALATVPDGSSRVFLSANVAQRLAELESDCCQAPSGTTLVTRTWHRLPAPGAMLDDIVATMAEVAGAVWPNWWGLDLASHGTRPAAEQGLRADLEDRAREQPAISVSWAMAAARLAAAGHLPLPSAHPAATQLKQLALAISPERLLLLLATTDNDASEPRLLALASGVEWVVRNSSAAVAVLLPGGLAEARALDPIRYQAIRMDPPHTGSQPSTPASSAEDRLRIWPVLGRPHPFSPGEQALARALGEDPELADLFEFNQPLTTQSGSHYVVDLLWRFGRLVVEVDGYHFHTTPDAFAQDRERDFELLISRYRVVRLTHDEVLTTPERALAKLRGAVRLCRTQTME